MKTDADYEAEAQAQYDADQASMALAELPPEVKTWLQGMWDETKALKRDYDERDCRYLDAPEREIRHLLDECKLGVVRFNEAMSELRAALSKMKKIKPNLTVIDGGRGE
jgi:hypothetical protein